MNDLVIMKDQQAVTSSLQVAETFNKNHRDILRAIDDLEKDVRNFAQMFSITDLPDTYGRKRRAFYMNRDGFTLLAMGFTGKKALKFKMQYIEAFNNMENELKQGYSTKNVGGYQVPSNYRGALLLAADLQEQVDTMKPKASYYDQLIANKSLMVTTAIAKDYGMSAKEFNKVLHKLKVQYKLGGQWFLYSKYHNRGWTSSATRIVDGTPRITTKWTQKGRVGLYRLLKKHDIVPMIEKLDIRTVVIGGTQ